MKPEHIVSVDRERCIGCALCRDDCPTGTILMEGGKAVIATQDCIKCGHCVAICPQNAVSISGFVDMPEPLTPGMKLDADALMGQLKARRSVRHFTAQKVEPEKIARIIEAGRYTPTGSNSQEVSYAVLTEQIDEYERTALQLFRRFKKGLDLVSKRFQRIEVDDHFLFKHATAVIVVKATDDVNGALAASSMELMAQSLGLGVFYSGFFTGCVRLSGTLRRKLGVPAGTKVVTTLVLGYPAVQYQRTAQREKANVLFN